jgi:hypothetical protein
MCRIAEVPMQPYAWNIAYGDNNVAWESGARQGVMRVNLAGTIGSVGGLLPAAAFAFQIRDNG